MVHKITVLHSFYVRLIVSVIFYLLDSLLFYIVGNNIGFLQQDGCSLFHGKITYYVCSVNYNQENSPFI